MRTFFYVILPALLLLIASLVLALRPEIDLAVSHFFFDPVTKWHWTEFPLFRWFEDKGEYPALILSIVALIWTILAWLSVKKVDRQTLYLALVMIVAPGVIVNAILKPGWGRPRPIEVTEFAGKYQFEPLFHYDASSPGKSFPSGHTSMGFYFFAVWMIGRKSGAVWAPWAFWGTVIYGTLMALCRIGLGKHYLSDTIWAAGICYFTALILGTWLLGKDNKNEEPTPSALA